MGAGAVARLPTHPNGRPRSDRPLAERPRGRKRTKSDPPAATDHKGLPGQAARRRISKPRMPLRPTAPGWQAGRLAGWQAGRLAGWQAGRLAGWQAGRLGRLAGWQGMPHMGEVAPFRRRLDVHRLTWSRTAAGPLADHRCSASLAPAQPADTRKPACQGLWLCHCSVPGRPAELCRPEPLLLSGSLSCDDRSGHSLATAVPRQRLRFCLLQPPCRRLRVPCGFMFLIMHSHATHRCHTRTETTAAGRGCGAAQPSPSTAH